MSGQACSTRARAYGLVVRLTCQEQDEFRCRGGWRWLAGCRGTASTDTLLLGKRRARAPRPPHPYLREHKIVLLFSLPLRPLVMTCGRKRTGRSECRGSIITAAVPSQARNSTTEDQHGKSPMRSRSSIGSRTSSLTRRDRARRVVVHLLLKGPTGPSLRRRPDLATQPDLRDLTSSSRRCARTPAGSRFSLLGISQPPCRSQRRWTRSRRSSPTTSAPSTSTRSTTRLWRGPTATPSTSAFARASTTQTRAWAAMP